MGRKDVSLLEVPAMAISSTDCRQVARNNPVWYLVPDGVVQYIAKYGLYAEGTPPTVYELPKQTNQPVLNEFSTSQEQPPSAAAENFGGPEMKAG